MFSMPPVSASGNAKRIPEHLNPLCSVINRKGQMTVGHCPRWRMCSVLLPHSLQSLLASFILTRVYSPLWVMCLK